MAARKVPMRQCIGCREMKEKSNLIRVIRTPEGDVCVDVTGKKNGRGAYICRSLGCFQKAVKTKGLSRAFQREIPGEVYERLKKEFELL